MKVFKSFFLSTAFGFLCLTAPVSAETQEPLTTVHHVDIPRYMGEWFEIASYPQWFSRNCYNTSANYTLRFDGKVDVLNKCHKGSPTGPIKTAKGVAYIANKDTNAELKVSFFWPFYGDYWIVELGEDYEYAVVSEPGRSSLWILSRTVDMDQEVLESLLDRLKNVHGFDLERLKYTRG
jgi:apolipoprotein D and lipocalin family protein